MLYIDPTVTNQKSIINTHTHKTERNSNIILKTVIESEDRIKEEKKNKNRKKKKTCGDWSSLVEQWVTKTKQNKTKNQQNQKEHVETKQNTAIQPMGHWRNQRETQKIPEGKWKQKDNQVFPLWHSGNKSD